MFESKAYIRCIWGILSSLCGRQLFQDASGLRGVCLRTMATPDVDVFCLRV